MASVPDDRLVKLVDSPPEPTRDDERQKPNDPLQEKLLICCWALADACREYLDAHRHDQESSLYDDVEGLLYNVSTGQGWVQSDMAYFPAWSKRNAMEAEKVGWTWGAAFWRFMAEDTEKNREALAAIEARDSRYPPRQPIVRDQLADNPFYAMA
jgi:hypothetical protein